MIVTWTMNKYPGKAQICIDTEEFNKDFDKTKEVFDAWDTKKWVRRKLLTASQLKKFFKSIKGFECDHTKDEILAELWNDKLRKVWSECYHEQA